MKKIKVLVTGIGAPGIGGTIYSLKNNFDKRPVEIIGTDITEDAVGKFLCSKSYVIPRASDKKNYLESLFDISVVEKPDAILPQNTAELLTLAENIHDFNKIGVALIVSNDKAIKKANNKLEILELCKNNNIPTVDFSATDNFNELIKIAKDLGWPKKKIVIKPPVSNGMRGVRVIDESIDLKKNFFEEKPSSFVIKMETLHEILGEKFPLLIVTDHLPGEEYSVDVLKSKKSITVVPRKRVTIRSGITFNGLIEKNNQIIEISRILCEILGLSYCFGFQFKLDEFNVPKLLECNPRVQGTMVMSTIAGANIIYGAIKTALNESIPDFDIHWGSSFHRYWGGIGITENSISFI